MKVYVVYWTDSEFEGDVVQKIFSTRRKAEEYVNYQNKISGFSWTHGEMEVE